MVESPCATLDEFGQWFAVTPPPPRLGGADKHSHRHDFYRIYERMLARYGDSAHLLEVGVAWGNSLAVWGAWFPRGEVVGVDLQLRDFRIHFGNVLSPDLGANHSGNVRAVVGDAMSKRFRTRLMASRAGRGFDIIVDDSSHTVKDQIALFEELFPTLLELGGVYIVEDAWSGAGLVPYFASLASTHVWQEQVGTRGDDGVRARRLRIASENWRDHVVGVFFWRHLIAIEKMPLDNF